MDSKKDNKISPAANESRNIIVFSLLQHDSYLIFIYKKAERIISAIYLVSNIFLDSEPLKWQFRKLGLQILSQILSFKTEPLAKNDMAVILLSNLVRILSLLDIARVAGLVSEMNFGILKVELENLLQSVHFKSPDVAERNVLLDKEFFGVPEDQIIRREPSSHPADLSFENRIFETANEKRSLIYNWSEASSYRGRGYKGQDKGQYKGHIDVKDGPLPMNRSVSVDPSRSSPVLRVQGGNRQAVIVDLLKKKSDLNVKDFSLVIRDCSEKTIQRELLRLVGEGVLKKVGERRWSRYSLVP